MENTTACRQACWNLLQHQFPWWWSRDYSAYCYHSAGSSWNDFCSYRIYIQSLDFRDGASSGSPYGAATFVGDGSRQPTDLELVQAWHQGNIIATITKQLKEAA